MTCAFVLTDITREIEAIKTGEYEQIATELETQLEALQRRGGPRYAELSARLRPLLEAPGTTA